RTGRRSRDWTGRQARRSRPVKTRSARYRPLAWAPPLVNGFTRMIAPETMMGKGQKRGGRMTQDGKDEVRVCPPSSVVCLMQGCECGAKNSLGLFHCAGLQ